MLYTRSYGRNHCIKNTAKLITHKSLTLTKSKAFIGLVITISKKPIITPIVAPNEMFNGEIWKESIRLIDNKSCAIISFRIDFDEYNNGDSEKRILLTKELILKAIRKIKSKVDFDYEAFERDLNILSF